MKFPVESSQRLPRIEVFRIVESGLTTTASRSATDLPEGRTRGTIVESSSNHYTLTYDFPFSRVPNVHVQAMAADGAERVATLYANAVGSCSWFVEDAATPSTAVATHFCVTVVGFDTADVI